MKIIGVIPARYESTRLPGKPLADICGKPMILWVYGAVSKAKGIDECYVATDDQRIFDVCCNEGINVVMTDKNCATRYERVYEFSKIIDSDFYIIVNGDEPLISESVIEKMIPSHLEKNTFYAANAMTEIEDPVETFDTTNIKIAVDSFNNGMYMARMPIPYPKGRSNYKLKKFVGVQCMSKEALKFIHETPRGEIEQIEDIDEFRIMENGKKLKFVMTDSDTISVDDKKDLERVRMIMADRLGI